VKDRVRDQTLDDETRIVIARSSAHPVSYAITLVTKYADREWAVRTYDNAHAFDEHHIHSYVKDQKQPPSVMFATVNDGMARAMRELSTSWRSYVEKWKRTF
jgi:hypothetical protein